MDVLSSSIKILTFAYNGTNHILLFIFFIIYWLQCNPDSTWQVVCPTMNLINKIIMKQSFPYKDAGVIWLPCKAPLCSWPHPSPPWVGQPWPSVLECLFLRLLTWLPATIWVWKDKLKNWKNGMRLTLGYRNTMQNSGRMWTEVSSELALSKVVLSLKKAVSLFPSFI